MAHRAATDPPSLDRPSGRRWLRHPTQVIVSAFGAVILVGAAVLMLPLARQGEAGAPFLVALFTSTSAVCVTGLTAVDTPTYWSGFGQAVILGLVQVGGFGIMTLASLVGLLVTRRMGLRTRITAAAETKSQGLGDLRRLLLGVAKVSIVFELLTAAVLAARFLVGYGETADRALVLGVFHAVSAFNNAGFALFSDSLEGFVTDPWVCVPIAGAVVAGGLGFPVIIELRRQLRWPRRWSLHTRLTIWTSVALLVGGAVFFVASEWENPATLGGLQPAERLLAGTFQAVTPRTAGFSTLDFGQMEEGTLLGTIFLMFIGGGSGGTAGGIKVTTFMLLLFVIYAEARGEADVVAGDRRIGERVQRQALSVVVLAMGIITSATLVLLELTELPMRDMIFETVSAFSTVGLTTGVTPELPPAGHLVLVLLMFVGRLGPITLVSALALRDRQRRFTLPEGRPLIG